MRAVFLAGIVVAATCDVSSAAGLLRNAGFESQDFTGWITSGKGWTIDKDVVAEGTCSALCTVGKGEKAGTRACLQKITGIEANRIIQVSLDVSGTNVARTPNSKACLAILCVDAGGNVLKEYRASVIKPTNAFRELKIDDAIVLPTTAQVYIMLVVEVYQTASNDDWWRFDNVKIDIL